MGLLEHINNHYFSQEKKQDGLLSLAEKFRDKILHEEIESDNSEEVTEQIIQEQPKIEVELIKQNEGAYDITKPYESFIRMCQEANLDKAGLFVENSSGFFQNFSYNFSDITVEKSKSTKSFWNGSLPESNWQYFQKEELIGFYQLFNSEEIESIYKVCFKRFCVNNRNFIFITTISPTQTIDTVYLEEIIVKFIESIGEFLKLNDNLEKNCTSSQLDKNIQDGLNKCLNGQYMELNIVQLLKKIDYLNKFELLNIGSHIFNILKKAVPEPNICIDYPGKIKFVYFANSEIDAQMFEVQIKNNLSDYLNNDILEMISITNYNSTSNAKTLKDLLLGK